MQFLPCYYSVRHADKQGRLLTHCLSCHEQNSVAVVTFLFVFMVAFHARTRLQSQIHSNSGMKGKISVWGCSGLAFWALRHQSCTGLLGNSSTDSSSVRMPRTTLDPCLPLLTDISSALAIILQYCFIHSSFLSDNCLRSRLCVCGQHAICNSLTSFIGTNAQTFTFAFGLRSPGLLSTVLLEITSFVLF